MSIEFWFEFASRYSYPAAMRVEALAAERGVALEWRAFLLGPIFHAQELERLALQSLPGEGTLHVARPRAHLRAGEQISHHLIPFIAVEHPSPQLLEDGHALSGLQDARNSDRRNGARIGHPVTVGIRRSRIYG
jgi:hypothetical protein